MLAKKGLATQSGLRPCIMRRVIFSIFPFRGISFTIEHLHLSDVQLMLGPTLFCKHPLTCCQAFLKTIPGIHYGRFEMALCAGIAGDERMIGSYSCSPARHISLEYRGQALMLFETGATGCVSGHRWHGSFHRTGHCFGLQFLQIDCHESQVDTLLHGAFERSMN